MPDTKPTTKPTTRGWAARLVALSAALPLMGPAGCDCGSDTAGGAGSSGDEASGESVAGLEGDPDLPGVSKVNEELDQRLITASRDKGPDYEPRTHHFEDDGETPTYVNRLILETSPYLLQHAHNPVNWYSWGDAAFERAKERDKPILLSVGYSTCHWCHVMERESFEDEEIAEYINRHYVAIKVDREERPDVDSVYMKAVNILSGRGGWPMTVVMTPEREPFFGGTYFPARTGDRGARKGFFTILEELHERYESEPDEVVAEAEKVSRRIRAAAEPRRPGDVPGPEAIARTARQLAQSFDPVWGGFGRAPKFPQPVKLEMLLRYHRRTGDEQALTMVTHTLDKMAAGGMYDHVGGGFHRYSTDQRWFAPHFEKMLYDNAQLAKAYLEAHQVTGDDDFARVATEILDYVGRDMTAPNGGFYSATDADSPTPEGHDEEGYFFTWTPDELEEVLGTERARIVGAYYDVSEGGNFEGRNILHTPKKAAVVATELGISEGELRSEVQAARQQLYETREKRPPPIRDEKIITSWNGMMISAFARAALTLGRDDYAQRARKAAELLLAELRGEDGRLMRTYKNDRAQHNAYLSDYAFLIEGLLDLYEVSGEIRWLEEAIALQETLDEHYADEENGGYFATSHDHEELLVREKPTRDGAEPSGNSVALLDLLRLDEFTSEEAHRERAEKGFAAFSRKLSRGGTGSTKMLSALDFYLDSPLEILVVEPEGGGDPEPLLARLRDELLPNRILGLSQEGESLEQASSVLPLLKDKRAIDGQTTAYVCEKGHCELPTPDPEVFAGQIDEAEPLFENRNPRPLPVMDPEDRPEPWEYDAEQDRHWHPGHGHWHEGRPPQGRR